MVHDVRIGMLTRPNDIGDGLNSLVNRVLSIQTKLHDIQRILIPKRIIIVVLVLIINQGMVIELGSTFSFGGMVKGLAHTGLNEGVVDILMALFAGIDTDIFHGVIEVKILMVGGSLIFGRIGATGYHKGH